MGLREVKKELNTLDKTELIQHISELYKKYKPVKEYFDFQIDPDEKKLLKQYKEKVTEGFFPTKGYQIKLSISRKAISDFKKLGTSPESVADLLLHFVENGVKFTNEYGDIDDNFYTSVGNTFSASLKLISKNNLFSKFKKRANTIVSETEHIGWDFHDYLKDTFTEYYE